MKWNIVEHKWVGQFDFKNQTELAEFLLKIAVYADSIKHHPDYTVFQCSKVKFTLFTHDKNQITDLDYQLSEFITDLYRTK